MPQFVGVLRPITALLIATLLFSLGMGLVGVLVPLGAKDLGFSDFSIGIMGSIYFTGFVLGCILTPGMIARVGHIRAFTALTAILTVSPLLHSLAPDVILWSIARAIAGFCIAGLFMCLESWLAGAAEVSNRGRIMGVYLAVHQFAMTLGMQLISSASTTSFVLFSLCAVLFSLGAVPVSLTGTSAPPLPRKPKLRIGWLMGVSPAAAIGAFLIGVANSAFLSLAPLYVAGAGLSSAMVAIMLAIAMTAGAVCQFPIGSAADKYGRRPALVVTGLASAVGGLGLYVAANAGAAAIAVAMFFYGAATFSIYGIIIAHANDLVHKKRAVEVSSGLLLLFSIGAVIGPSIAAVTMEVFGHGGLFLHTAIFHGALASVVFVRRQLRPKLPRRRRRKFRPVTRVTTPAVYQLDPRGEAAPEAPDAIAEAVEASQADQDKAGQSGLEDTSGAEANPADRTGVKA